MALSESEWVTRKKRIDSKLKAMNPAWEIIRYKDGLELSRLNRHAVEEFPTDNGPADYALFVDGQLLGIIEAKKVTVNPQNVLEQAKRYAAPRCTARRHRSGSELLPFLSSFSLFRHFFLYLLS